MKNFEKHVNKIAYFLWNFNYLKNIKHDYDKLHLISPPISFPDNWGIKDVEDWLMEEVEEEKIKVSKAEYDVLYVLNREYGDTSFKNIVQVDKALNILVNELGWFNSIEPIMSDTLLDILNRVEVAPKRSLTFMKDGSYRLEGEE